MGIRQDVERLADTMHEIAQWSRSHPNYKKFSRGFVKLPPVFLVDDEKHGSGRENLIAMLRVLADYEEGAEDGNYPRLQELPERYNEYGGKPLLTGRDMRRVHNWIQQLSFGVRAAVLEDEIKGGNTGSSIAERVYGRLYEDCHRRSFVTYAPDNKYEYKPLKNADREAKLRWIAQEVEQRRSMRRGRVAAYGARPTEQEWERFGLMGQPVRTACTQLQADLDELVKLASTLDNLGRYSEADEIDEKISRISAELNLWDAVGT